MKLHKQMITPEWRKERDEIAQRLLIAMTMCYGSNIGDAQIADTFAIASSFMNRRKEFHDRESGAVEAVNALQDALVGGKS